MSYKNIEPSHSANILKIYSNLLYIIDEFKNTTIPYYFLAGVNKFDSLIDINIYDAYHSLLFNECKENKKVTEEILEIFKHLANSYLISNVVKNKIEDEFCNFLSGLLQLKDNIVRDIGSVFSDNDYIYFPKIIIEDIIYCFKYGKDNDICGKLNPTHYKNIIIKNYDSKEDYLNKLESEILKGCNNDIELINQIKMNILSIKLLFQKFEKIKFNFNYEWILTPMEILKQNALENINKILIKNKNIFNFENLIEDVNKIPAKVVYALFEGNQLPPKINKILYLDDAIISLQKEKKNYKYGYRILGFYDCNIFEDNVSKTLILIIKTINEIILSNFEKYKEDKIFYNIIKNIYQESIKDIISTKSPNFDELNIIYIFNFLLYSLLNEYKLNFLNKLNDNKNILNIAKNKFITLIKQFKKESISKINSKINKYNDSYTTYINFLNSYEFKQALEGYKNSHNCFGRFYNYFTTNDDYYINKFINTNEFEELLAKKGISEPKKSENWEEDKQNIENISKELLEIQNLEDIKIIQKKIINHKFKNFEYVDKSLENKYFSFLKELDSAINKYIIFEKKFHYSKFQTKIEEKFIKYKGEKGDNLDLEILYNLIESLNPLKYFYQIFKIEKISINNYFNDEYTLNNNIIKKYGNFIFNQNNEPSFLKKSMKINFGLYILNNGINEISSTIIQNNYSKSIRYLIKQEENNIIVLNCNNNKKLKALEDLKINFKIINNNLKFGFYQSIFEVILLDSTKEFDKCIVYIYIYVIPLIIKLSLLNEKFSIDNNRNLFISHYFEKMKILYSFPGNYFPSNLSIELKNNDNQFIKINQEFQGEIELSSLLRKMQNNILKCKLDLFLNKLYLLNFKLKFEKPKFFGLFIFDENNLRLDLQSLYLMKKMTKDIFIMNMTYNKIDINFDYDKNQISINYMKKEIEPGNYLKIQINNINIKEKTQIKINNKSIEIENIEFPKIIIKKEYNNRRASFSNLKGYQNNEYTNQFRLFFINKCFFLKKESIEGGYDYNNFSTYLIYNNKIIQESKYVYIYQTPRTKKVFGFSDGKFGIFKFYDINLKIALAYSEYTTDYNLFNSIFNDNQRDIYKSSIKNIKLKICSSYVKDVNEAISSLINKNINIEDENSIKNLEISNEKTSAINILIYLFKYSFNFKTSNELKLKLLWYYKRMYQMSNREIKQYFIPKIKKEKLKIFLEKVSYIISFVFLCLSPGDIMEYDINNDFESKNELILKQKNSNLTLLENQFKKDFKILSTENVINKEIIYYDEKIYIHDENDEFSKYEKEIKEIKIKFEDDDLKEEKKIEFLKSCHKEIINLIDDINNNKINISNLLLFLERCKKYLRDLPFILYYNDNKEQINEFVQGAKLLFFYLEELEKTKISKSKFGDLIINMKNEYEIFYNKFSNTKSFSTQKNYINNDYESNLNNQNNNKHQKNQKSKNLKNNLYWINKTEIYNFDTSEPDKYESKFKSDKKNEENENRYKVIFKKNSKLSSEIIKSLSIEGIGVSNKQQILFNQNAIILNNDLTEFKQERYEFKTIKKLYEDKNISTTIILKDIITIVKENKNFALIKDINNSFSF